MYRSLNIVNPINVVSYCETRLNPEAVNAIIKQGKLVGLSDSEALNENLKSGKYIPVLNAIWSERDRSRRLEWLRSHAPEMHAPLMFEQSIAEFVNNPIVETIIQISMPLITSAAFRVRQDSKCSADPSVYNGDAAKRMQITYIKSLNIQTVKHLKKELTEIIGENKSAITSAIKAKTLDVATLSISNELPLPNWIGYHGMSVVIRGDIEMHPEADFKKYRDDVAREEIQQNT